MNTTEFAFCSAVDSMLTTNEAHYQAPGTRMASTDSVMPAPDPSNRRIRHDPRVCGHRLHAIDDYARVDYCIAGFRGLTDRLCQHIDSAPLLRLEQRFAAGAPMTVDLIDDALRMLRMVEDELIKHTVYAVQDAVLVEQIMIELEAIAEDRKAA
jgi:hypothetical protein